MHRRECAKSEQNWWVTSPTTGSRLKNTRPNYSRQQAAGRIFCLRVGVLQLILSDYHTSNMESGKRVVFRRTTWNCQIFSVTRAIDLNLSNIWCYMDRIDQYCYLSSNDLKASNIWCYYDQFWATFLRICKICFFRVNKFSRQGKTVIKKNWLIMHVNSENTLFLPSSTKRQMNVLF